MAQKRVVPTVTHRHPRDAALVRRQAGVAAVERAYVDWWRYAGTTDRAAAQRVARALPAKRQPYGFGGRSGAPPTVPRR
jgi:hypothetical protein